MVFSVRQKLKRNQFASFIFFFLKAYYEQFGLKVLQGFRAYLSFFSDFHQLSKIKNNNFNFSYGDIRPCLLDKLSYTPLEPVYFYQDSWLAKNIFVTKPLVHFDVGSSAKTIGILSQFIPTTMIDIRPIDLKLNNLSFIKGSILKLPFEDGALQSISSICVIEHIGLGRYGDPIDAFGSEKAISELKRVLAVDGNLFISLPVFPESRIFFNDCRAFSRKHILELFSELELIEEKYQYGRAMYDSFDSEKGFGTGMFYFKKRFGVKI